MTSWRIVTCLFAFVSLIASSKEDCFDYFKIETWDVKNLGESFVLIRERDSRDLIKCTLEHACNTTNDINHTLCHVVQDCFGDSEESQTLTCDGQRSQNISFYHLMCLTAKALKYPPTVLFPEGCKYKNVCELHSKIQPLDQTTTLSPATTTLSPATTVLPSMTATETAWPLTATTPGTTTVIRGQGGRGNASTLHGTGPSTMKNWLIISTISNVLLPLVVYLYMRRKTRDQTHNGAPLLDGSLVDPEAQPLTQQAQCDPSASPSADTTMTECAAGHRTPL